MRKVTVVAAASLPKAGFVLSQVFRNTMFGPEGRPQHCCAWLGGASSFSNCSRRVCKEDDSNNCLTPPPTVLSIVHIMSWKCHEIYLVMKIGRDAILYVESLIESIIGGLEGLINILDSEGGFGALETQLLQSRLLLLNESSRVSIPASKSLKEQLAFLCLSYPENNSAIKMYGL
uniref:Uncharacterized protein n=1 Tax=Salix viminalis TaxID=40686 RepID=A0A6N2NDS7_SALVM